MVVARSQKNESALDRGAAAINSLIRREQADVAVTNHEQRSAIGFGTTVLGKDLDDRADQAARDWSHFAPRPAALVAYVVRDLPEDACWSVLAKCEQFRHVVRQKQLAP